MCMEIDDPVKQCYELQASSINVRNWVKELKEELYSIRLAFVRKNKRSQLGYRKL
jgi:hypothetical protein